MTLTPRKVASGFKNYPMWSGGCECSLAKQLDSLLSSSLIGQRLYYRRYHVEISKSRSYQEREADEARQLELDSVEEARINALTQSARYLQGVRRYHDRNVQQRSFNIGDLVLRRIQDETGLHKLNSRWEGPFIVTKVTRPGSYRIADADGNEVSNSWNIEHLRKFYP